MIIFILLLILLILFDQLSKLVARKYLKDKNGTKGFLRFYYLENSGSAMGRFSGRLWFLSLCTLLSFIAFFILLKKYNLTNNFIYSFGLLLAISGTIGNFIDRLTRFYVIDFFYFQIKKKSSPVFNIADFEILFGLIMIIIGFII